MRRRVRLHSILVLILFCFVCSSTSARSVAASATQPANWDGGLKLPEAPDTNADPRIVEVNLDARIADVEVGGHHVQAWTYNGGVPGPLIRAKVGDRLI